MLSIKIKGATPQSGKSICLSCKMATMIRGQNCEELVKCGLFDQTSSRGFVPFKVCECGQYHPANMPWKHEMEEMAWKIEARRRGPTGFKRDQPIEVIIMPPKSDRSVPE